MKLNKKFTMFFSVLFAVGLLWSLVGVKTAYACSANWECPGCECCSGGSCGGNGWCVNQCGAAASPTAVPTSAPAGCTSNSQCPGCECCSGGVCGGNGWCVDQCGTAPAPTTAPATCNTTCPAGKTHMTECSGTESNCSAISQPAGCNSTYTCCTCTPAPAGCTSCSGGTPCNSCNAQDVNDWYCQCTDTPSSVGQSYWGSCVGVHLAACFTPLAVTCTSFTYSDWSNCTNNTQTRTVTSSSPSGCTGGSPVLTQDCTTHTSHICSSYTNKDNCCYNTYCVMGGTYDCNYSYPGLGCTPLSGCSATWNTSTLTCDVNRNCVGSSPACVAPNYASDNECPAGHEVSHTAACGGGGRGGCGNVGFCCSPDAGNVDGRCSTTASLSSTPTTATGCRVGTISNIGPNTSNSPSSSIEPSGWVWQCNGTGTGGSESCYALKSCPAGSHPVGTSCVNNEACPCAEDPFHCGAYTQPADASVPCTANANCIGTMSCNDGNSCTTDSCDPNDSGTCLHAPATPVPGTCPACSTTSTHVGSCPGTDCPANAPAAGSCNSLGCHSSASSVPNGSCGTISCPANAPANFDCSSLGCHTSDVTGKPDGNCGTKTCFANAPAAGSCNSLGCHITAQTVPDGSCGTITCPANAPAQAFCSSLGCHTSTQTVPDGSCGSTSCPPNAPAAGNCASLGCHVNASTVPDGSCGSISCPGNAPAAGSCPVCRTVSSIVDDGSCGTINCPINCSASCFGNICDNPPSYTSGNLIIKNVNDVLVNPEIGQTNQLCDSQFANSRTVKFIVIGTDLDGDADITDIKLRWNGTQFARTSLVNGVATFDVTLPADLNDFTAHPFYVYIADSQTNTGWVQTERSLKIWDCKVPVQGSLFDGSFAAFDTISCTAGSTDFTTKVKSSMLYTLVFSGTTFDSDKVMNVTHPDYSSNGNNLFWGAAYRPDFTAVDGVKPVMRYPGDNSCNPGLASFVVDNSPQMKVDPYAPSPSLNIDFSSFLIQLPWYQAAGGGVIAKNNITDNIPNTCIAPCKSNVSMNGTDAGNGLVAAQDINTGSGSYGETNQWSVNRNVINSNYSYKYFYNEYYVKLSRGKVYDVGTSGITLQQIVTGTGGTGVVLVNGVVNVTTPNTVPVGSFFMLIASDDINVDPAVSSMQGLFITDKAFNSTGMSDSKLVIDGSVYSKTNVRLTRGFVTGTLNNRNPAVLVNYRPDFIFSMPGALTKILSGWREGI